MIENLIKDLLDFTDDSIPTNDGNLAEWIRSYAGELLNILMEVLSA